MFNNFQKLLLAGLLIAPPLSSFAAVTCINENVAINATTEHLDVISPGIIPGEVYDDKTDLTWQRCSLGRVWDADESTCTGLNSRMSWPAALAAARDEAENTGVSWRLPNIKELSSIVEQRCYSPAIDSAIFPDTRPSSNTLYWSSSVPANVVNHDAWALDVSFDGGFDDESRKPLLLNVRLVRSGQ